MVDDKDDNNIDDDNLIELVNLNLNLEDVVTRHFHYGSTTIDYQSCSANYYDRSHLHDDPLWHRFRKFLNLLDCNRGRLLVLDC